MKLKTRVFLASATSGIVALAGIAGLASLAAAATAPSVTPVIQNGSNVTISSAVVGTLFHVSVVVASSSTTTIPTGTADFNLYAGTSCLGVPTAQTGVVLTASGSAQSATTTLPIGGLSYTVHYSGDTNFVAGDSGCVPISATQVAPAISLSLSNNNVQAGSFVYGISNLTGESATASGTLQYNVYSNNTCTTLALTAGQKTVTNGATPNSDSWQFITPGTYYWQVAYSGDLNNAAATSSCGTVLTVVATTPTPPPTGPGTISGTVFNDLNRDGDQDAGEPGIAGLKVWLHQKATTTAKWWKRDRKSGYNAPIVMTATTDSNGNYSFANLSPGNYFVEQEEPKGWNQKSSDRRVVLDDAHPSADVDFANVEKKKKDDNNGNHHGWQRFVGNLVNFDGWIKWNK